MEAFKSAPPRPLFRRTLPHSVRVVHLVRPSRGMPVSFLASGGLSVPPPDYRSLRPRPDNKVGKVTQVNRAVVRIYTHIPRKSVGSSLVRRHRVSIQDGHEEA